MSEALSPADKQELSQLMKDIQALSERGLKLVEKVTPKKRVGPPVFPEPLSGMVSVTDEGDFWVIRPRQYLGTENFAEILRIVKGYDGQYVSAGKSSHFRIRK